MYFQQVVRLAEDGKLLKHYLDKREATNLIEFARDEGAKTQPQDGFLTQKPSFNPLDLAINLFDAAAIRIDYSLNGKDWKQADLFRIAKYPAFSMATAKLPETEFEKLVNSAQGTDVNAPDKIPVLYVRYSDQQGLQSELFELAVDMRLHWEMTRHRQPSGSLTGDTITDEDLKRAQLSFKQSLDLTNTSISDDGIKANLTYVRCPKLNNLNLSKTQITDESLRYLAKSGLPRMDTLIISNTKVSDVGIGYLIGETTRYLEVLDLSSTNVTDECVESLIRLSYLEKLNLTGTKISKDGVNRFLQVRQRCQVTR